VRVHWIQILKTFWKYLKVSFRVPIEIVEMKTRNATTRSELLDGQREIIARQTTPPLESAREFLAFRYW
jgi:hypothetical protein